MYILANACQIAVPVVLLEFLQWYDDNDDEQKWKGWLFAG